MRIFKTFLFISLCFNAALGEVTNNNSIYDSMLRALADSLYHNQTILSEGSPLNNSQVLKSLSLDPGTSFYKSGVPDLLDSTILARQLSDAPGEVASPTGIVSAEDIVRCTTEALPSLFSGSNSSASFQNKAIDCYNGFHQDNPEASNLAKNIFSQVSSLNSLRSYADAVKFKLYLGFCANEPFGFQKSLQPCSEAAAHKLFDDTFAWWNSFKKQDHIVPISQQVLTTVDSAFLCPVFNGGECSSNVNGNALSVMSNVLASFISVVDIAKNDLVVQIASIISKENSRENIDSSDGLAYLFNVDKIDIHPAKSCWTKSLNDENFQAVNVTVGDVTKVESFLSSIVDNFSVQLDFPKIDLPDPFSYFSVSSLGNIKFVDAEKESGLLVSDWKDNNKDLDGLNAAKEYRVNQLRLIDKLQHQYRDKASMANVLNKSATDSLNSLIKLRVHNKTFSVDVNSNCAPNNQASTEEWSKVSAFMRQNKKWTESIKDAKIADTLKQAVYLLSEIRTQLYLNNQLQQKMLASQAISQLAVSTNVGIGLSELHKQLEDAVKDYRAGGSSNDALAESANAGAVDPNTLAH